jgi:hypothetical protein
MFSIIHRNNNSKKPADLRHNNTSQFVGVSDNSR